MTNEEIAVSAFFIFCFVLASIGILITVGLGIALVFTPIFYLISLFF